MRLFLNISMYICKYIYQYERSMIISEMFFAQIINKYWIYFICKFKYWICTSVKFELMCKINHVYHLAINWMDRNKSKQIVYLTESFNQEIWLINVANRQKWSITMSFGNKTNEEVVQKFDVKFRAWVWESRRRKRKNVTLSHTSW